MVFELGDADSGAARDFLLRAPEKNLPLLAALDKGSDSFLGVKDEQGLAGLVLLQEQRALAMTSVRDLAAAKALGQALGELQTVETLLGERETMEVLWQAMSAKTKPRLVFDQALLKITANDMGPFTCPQLRQATAVDLPQVQAIAEAMFIEEIGFPPALDILHGHVAQEVEAGAIWVVDEGGALAFLVQVATRCAQGVELQRVYTVPRHRRRGLATLAIGQICRTLLGSLPVVTLRVHESNDAAMELYWKLGFHPCAQMRLICI